jgi:hypothetical protein
MEAEPPTGGEAYTDLLYAVMPYHWLSDYDLLEYNYYTIFSNNFAP